MSIIKALYDFQSVNDNELSFEAGENFLVLSDAAGEWCEVERCDKADRHPTEIYGMVPKAFFSPQTPVIEKSDRKSYDAIPPMGIMLYDFTPERYDELAAKNGDSLFLLAQADGWFLAKHISRVDPPGLVPASYLSIKSTHQLLGIGLTETRSYLNIPTVAEWKARQPQLISIRTPTSTSLPSPAVSRRTSDSAVHSLVLATIKSYQICDTDTLVFNLDVFRMGQRNHRIQRSYSDFYTLQKTLLDRFPEQSGKTNGRRIIPYFPAPSPDLDEQVAKKRKTEINYYLKKLLELPPMIRKSGIVLDFFMPWPVDSSVPNMVAEHPVDDSKFDSFAPVLTFRKLASSGDVLDRPELSKKAGLLKVAKNAYKKVSLPPRLKMPSHTSTDLLKPVQEETNRSGSPLISAPLSSSHSARLFHFGTHPESSETYSAASLGNAIPVISHDFQVTPKSDRNTPDSPVEPSIPQPKIHKEYIKIKVVEPEMISYFKVSRKITLDKLRSKMASSLGVDLSAKVFYQDARDRRIKSLETSDDFEDAVAQCEKTLTVHT